RKPASAWDCTSPKRWSTLTAVKFRCNRRPDAARLSAWCWRRRADEPCAQRWIHETARRPNRRKKSVLTRNDTAPPPPAPTELNVVVIDDDDVDIENVRRALRRFGRSFHLSVARDGLEGLSLLRTDGIPS